jgi:membrane protein DedA with SNARE-associated domain
VGALAALENIVPPVPADVAVALGAFLSARGADVSPLGIFLVTWLANVASATMVFVAARRFGRPFFATRLGRRLLSPGALDRISEVYRRWHLWGIFASRFLPGYRAVVPPFAGLTGVKVWHALPPIAVASGLYYGLLVFLVHRLGENWASVERALGHAGAWMAGGAVVATLALLVWWRRRRATRAATP